MTMADVLAIIASTIIIGLGFPSLFLILTMLFPQAVEHANNNINTKPIRLIGRGLLLFIILFFIVAILGNANVGPIKLLNFIIIMTTLSTAMIGGAGLANNLAARYRTFTGKNNSAGNLFYSTLIFETALAIPLIGWFVMLPITLLLMLGSGFEAIRHTRKQAKTEQESATEIPTFTAPLTK